MQKSILLNLIDAMIFLLTLLSNSLFENFFKIIILYFY